MNLTDITFASLYFNFILNGNPLFQRTNGDITYIFIRDTVLEVPIRPPNIADCLTFSRLLNSTPTVYLSLPPKIKLSFHTQSSEKKGKEKHQHSLAFIKMSTVYIISSAICDVQNISFNRICNNNHGNTSDLEFQNIILCKYLNF